MRKRSQRLWLIGVAAALVTGAAALAVVGLQGAVAFFQSPSDIAAKGASSYHQSIRVGGLVENGSVQREPGSLEVRFTLTDFANTVGVSYTGVLPDLFREGQGVIARGRLNEQGMFVAEEVLAKHDEKYVPREMKNMTTAEAKAVIAETK